MPSRPDARPARARSVPVTIRAGTVADVETVLQLRFALLREHGDHPVYGRLRDDAEARARTLYANQLASRTDTIFLAEQGGEAVGILRCVEAQGSPLLHPARYGYVSSVYVAPAARRHGVLRALMRAADDWCRARGIGELRLHNASDNPGANAAWEALGFEIVEVLRVRRIPEG